MALVHIDEAMRLTGKSRAKLYKMMKTGELSFVQSGDGRRTLDTTELLRVLGSFVESRDSLTNTGVDTQKLQDEIDKLRLELAYERRTTEDLRDSLADARENLKTVRSAMLMLENKSQTAPQQPAPEPEMTKKERKRASLLGAKKGSR